jgi:cell division protein FtsL
MYTMGKHESESFAGKQQATPQAKKMVVGTGKGRRKIPKVVYALVLLLVAVILVVVGYCLYKHYQKPPISAVCTDAISQEANAQNKSANLTTFANLTYRIKSKANYAHDPNCQYILAEYQISSGSLDAAQTTMNQIKTDHGSNYAFNKNLDDGQASLSKLQKQFDMMQKAQDNSDGVIDPAI